MRLPGHVRSRAAQRRDGDRVRGALSGWAAQPTATSLSEKWKYRTWTVQQKLDIVLAGLRGDRSVAELCREHETSENLYYS